MAVMIITLTIVLFSVIANATFNYTVQQIRDKIDISVYLKDDVTEEQKNTLVDNLKNISNVKSVSYISKEQALKSYIDQNQDNLDLQLAISETDNPLPASLNIKIYNPDNITPIKDYLERSDIKKMQSDPTSYSGDRKEAIDKIAKATSFLRRAGVIGVIVFAVISVLIIFNTIQMAIFNRRDELAIMKLLGASKWYIRGPFLVESMLIGVASAIVSVIFCNATFSIASSTLNASSFGLLDISYASNYFSHHLWAIFGSQLLIGVVIAVGSSFVATQRYLRVKSSKN